MTWNIKTSKGHEVRKIRNRIVKYLDGLVLDIGCGDEKVFNGAIGVDFYGKAANLRLDLSDPNSLRIFSDNMFDVVFSSHFLEDIYDYKTTLKEMWRLVKPDGHLILYLPHKDLYPNIGQTGANPSHRHDFIPQDIISVFDNEKNFTLIQNKTRKGGDEYSFEIIARKDLIKIPAVKSSNKQKAIVVRYGGYGDMVISAPVFRLLKEQGYYTIGNCKPDSSFVWDNNPYIDEFLLQSKYLIPSVQLGEYFNELRKKYYKVINLCESLERSLLIEERDEVLFNLSHEDRHEMCNVNYSDKTMELSGFSNTGLLPELYLSNTEKVLGSIFKEKHKDCFLVQWQLSGSAWHKIYPHADVVMERLLEKHKDIAFILTGPQSISLLGWDHPRIINRIGMWNARQSMIMTSFVDLVVSPETGVLNAAGSFDVPKIALLTHSSKENLTKYFKNTISLQSQSPCSPCHRLVETLEKCPLDDKFKLPVCMSKYMPQELVESSIEQIYNKGKVDVTDNHTVSEKAA